jgi:hypothetical protein
MCSSDFKQYTSDAAIAAGLTLLAIKCIGDSVGKRWRIAFVAAAPIAIFFSFTAAMVIAGAIAAWMLQAALQRAPKQFIWPTLLTLSTLITGIILLAVNILPASRSTYLQHFWRDAFWPVWPIRIRTFTFPLFNLVAVFRRPVGLESGSLGLVLAIVGIAALWQRERFLAALFGIPLLIAMLASAMHLYPFEERLLLFAVPGAAVLIASGLRALYREGRMARLVAIVSMLIIFGLESIRFVKMWPMDDVSRFLQ